ncbi:hypothetical protein O181_087451 [Austropuccinia psidii MF-1]|uniref:Uncharacterized protein n=1 Tax=Austropuccinia psidii MF-1 TaxID=1389203 RepID=A0A9Q3IPP0_9BASI|nr:hypothetical protein [Austropuccinia psidii MF-1]
MDPNPPILAKNPKDPISNQGPPVAHFQPWPLVPPEATSSDPIHSSPQLKGKISHSSTHPVFKDAGVVHIWYYIPLCTIFSQKSNGDVFRTQFQEPKSRPQNSSTISKEDSAAQQSGNPWGLSEDHFRTPTTWPCRSWVGNSFRIIPKAILRVYASLNQLSRQKVLQYSLDNSIDPYRQQSIIPVCAWPNWANSYSTVGIQSHSSILRMARTVLTQFIQ